MENLNYMPDVEFIKVHPDAKLPAKTEGRETDTGFDLFAVEEVTIPARGCNIVPVGIKVGYIPEGYWFKIEARSGLGFKHSLMPHPGIIDNPYRGDCGVKIYNFSDTPYTFKKEDRCAQIVFYLNLSLKLKWAAVARPSVRGENGFGSSGK